MFPLKDANPSSTLALANWVLIACCLVVFLLELLLPHASAQALGAAYGAVPFRLTHDFSAWQLLTVFTSMFLHAGWYHLITNMWILFIFGDNVEDRFGHVRYPVFYLLCGAMGMLAQTLSGPNQTTPTIGASGAIAGVLAAYMVMFPGAKIKTLVLVQRFPFIVDLPAYLYVGLWFVSQFIPQLFFGGGAAAWNGVAWWAHIGGFLSGLLFVKLFQRRHA
jgi:membrane associated rhomboid family serine protease